ncbi:MAG: ParB/RepB/Spo0J family partition protein [Candidatus Saccharibacteria bacterium]|nr:ParB/RepB/Spo0J family partition protein [Candidatus Saccharibacteria bacterium]
MAGLGRGFESLIPTDFVDTDFDVTAEEDEKESALKELPISDVVRDEEQPRKEFSEEALDALANSISKHGVLQPIVVVKEGKKYKIVAGERRWRASKKAGLSTIPAIIRTLDTQNRLELSIIENAQREDLNAIEMATAYAKLKTQFNLEAKEIAERVGKSESSVVNTMRLLNLPESAKKAMVEHKLTEGVMRPLINAEPELINKYLPLIIEEGWTARKVERVMSEQKKKSSIRAVKASIYTRQEDSLSKKYAAKVKISGRSIKITCKNDEELKELLKKLA